jgi:hypothetical protein
MKFIPLTAIIAITANFSFAQIKLPELRQLYLAAVENEQKSNEFMKHMNSIDRQDALLYGYFASAQALASKHISAPSDKLKYLKLADKSFEEAIQKQPENAEVRFLRFSVQINIPRFLGFSDDIEKDIQSMVANIPKTNSIQEYPEWKKIIINFLIDSGKCSDEQSSILKTMLK